MLSERMLHLAERRLSKMTKETIRDVYVKGGFYSVNAELREVMTQYSNGSIDIGSAKQVINDMRLMLDGRYAGKGCVVTEDGDVFKPWVTVE